MLILCSFACFMFIEIRCPSLAQIPNTISTNWDSQDSYTEGFVIVFECEVGYEQINGDAMRTCQSDSTWSGTNITCQRKPLIEKSQFYTTLVLFFNTVVDEVEFENLKNLREVKNVNLIPIWCGNYSE